MRNYLKLCRSHEDLRRRALWLLLLIASVSLPMCIYARDQYFVQLDVSRTPEGIIVRVTNRDHVEVPIGELEEDGLLKDVQLGIKSIGSVKYKSGYYHRPLYAVTNLREYRDPRKLAPNSSQVANLKWSKFSELRNVETGCFNVDVTYAFLSALGVTESNKVGIGKVCVASSPTPPVREH